MNLTEIYWLLHTYTNTCDCSVYDDTQYLDLWGLKRVLYTSGRSNLSTAQSTTASTFLVTSAFAIGTGGADEAENETQF